MIRVAVPDSVHAVVDAEGRLVLLNVDTGRWHVLNSTGADVYERLRELADLDLATEALLARHRTVPVERIRRDVDELVEALVLRGLLEVVDEHPRAAAGVPVALVDDDEPAPLRYRVAATVAFPLALLLLRAPFRFAVRLVGRVNRTRPVATPSVARTVLTAVRWAGRRHPGRVACLELSLTAVLTAALLGRRVDWCLGFAADPYTFHAWIEVDGEPIVHPSDEPIPPTYRRVFRA